MSLATHNDTLHFKASTVLSIVLNGQDSCLRQGAISALQIKMQRKDWDMTSVSIYAECGMKQ